MLIGELDEVRYRFQDNTYTVTIRCEQIPQELNELSGKKVKCEIKKFSAARSLNANALFHMVVGIIANNIGASSIFVKYRLLCDYGQMDEGKTVLIRSDVDVTELEELHLKPSGRRLEYDDVEYIEYFVMRGSHTYDSREMSILIQGAKDELSALGISMPISDKEVERILGKWRKD